MPTNKALLLQICFQVPDTSNFMTIEQTKRILAQRGINQVQHRRNRHNKFILVRLVGGIRTLSKERLIFSFTNEPPKDKRYEANHNGQCRKHLLLAVVQLGSGRRCRQAVDIEQMLTER